jgi:drug/metabolite transporter (DMT)-like permease
MPATPSRPLLAFAWMLVAIASFVLMAVAGRAVQLELSTFQLMAWRSLIGFGIVCALIAAGRRFGAGRGFAQLRSAAPGLHLIRNLWHFTGQNLWFFGLMAIPLSQLVALEFTMPIWVALLAPLLLGERLRAGGLIAALVCFAGVLIVARPGVQPLDWGHAAGLGAALCFALSLIYTRRIMAQDTVLCVLFWMTATQAVMGAAIGFAGGIAWPSAAVWPWLAVLGVTGLAAHYALTSALGHAPASTVAPMEFLRLPVIAAVGVALYGEPLDAFVFLGAAVIFAGNWINLRAARRPLPAGGPA